MKTLYNKKTAHFQLKEMMHRRKRFPLSLLVPLFGSENQTQKKHSITKSHFNEISHVPENFHIKTGSSEVTGAGSY